MLATRILSSFAGPPTSVVNESTSSFEGKKVKLMCQATNDIDAPHPVQVNWYKGNQLLQPDGGRVLVYPKLNTSNMIVSVLLFDPVNHTDDGDYTCRSFNDPLSFTDVTTSLTVECKWYCYDICKHFMVCILLPFSVAPMIMINPPSPHNSAAGDMLQINCTANGFPTPTVHLLRGGNPVSPVALRTVVYPVVPTHPQCHLVYICVAVNNAGNMTRRVYADITVNIIGKCKCCTLVC